MHFANPNILYALFLLAIPIIIHFLQLRRFRPTPFTNVAMLKQIEKQNRKSRNILQWIILLLRLLAFTAIIFAFAQPFIPKKETENTKYDYIVYIDNYLTWGAKMEKISVLEHFKNEVNQLQSISENFTWFTNDEIYYNQSLSDFKENILDIKLSANARTVDYVKLQAEHIANRNPNTAYKLLWISDFHRFEEEEIKGNGDIINEIYPLQATDKENTRIDTLFIDQDSRNLIVKLQHTGKPTEISLALYDNNKVLSRQKVSFTEDSELEVSFNFGNQEFSQAKVSFEDGHIQWDNTKYFSLSKTKPIEVRAIGDSNANYLKIFQSDEFNFKQISPKDSNFSELNQADLIVLYGMEQISSQIAHITRDLVLQGKHLLIIPKEQINLTSYNELLQNLGLAYFTKRETHKRRLSKIHFEHPLFNSVFEKEVENFQEPFLNSYYKLNHQLPSILSMDSHEAFLFQSENIYLFTAGLEETNTNFTTSPLIVPILHNIAQNSGLQKPLYHLISHNSSFEIEGDFDKQDLLQIENQAERFIPIQKHKSHAIEISTSDKPDVPGNYSIYYKNNIIEGVSYNYPNISMDIVYPDTNNWKDINKITKLNQVEFSQNLAGEKNTFWKWFVIFALIFIGIEIALLKIYR